MISAGSERLRALLGGCGGGHVKGREQRLPGFEF